MALSIQRQSGWDYSDEVTIAVPQSPHRSIANFLRRENLMNRALLRGSLLVFSFVGKNHPGHRVSTLGVSSSQLAVFIPAKGPENIALKKKNL